MVLPILLMLSAACGVVMVVGGIMMLYKGIITLGANAGQDAFTVEFKQYFRINTQVPALALFAIGWVFIALPLYYGRAETVNIVGNIDTPNPADVRIFACAGELQGQPSSNGQIDFEYLLTSDPIKFRVTAPGYRALELSVRKQVAPFSEVVQLGKVSMGTPVLADKPAPAQIAPAPVLPATATQPYGAALVATPASP